MLRAAGQVLPFTGDSNMAVSGAVPEIAHGGERKRLWAWEPPLPLTRNPVFVWPPRIFASLRYLFSGVYFWSLVVPFGVLGALTWYFLQPPLERCTELEAGWIALMLVRNLAYPGHCCVGRAAGRSRAALRQGHDFFRVAVVYRQCHAGFAEPAADRETHDAGAD